MVAGSATRRVGEVLLVDVPIDSDGWAEQLPPCPRGAAVTVLFSDAECEVVHAEALARLGYEVAGVLARPEATAAQLAVPRAAAEAHPRWWSALLTLATQVWDTALGPAAMVAAPALRAHGITER